MELFNMLVAYACGTVISSSHNSWCRQQHGKDNIVLGQFYTCRGLIYMYACWLGIPNELALGLEMVEKVVIVRWCFEICS